MYSVMIWNTCEDLSRAASGVRAPSRLSCMYAADERSGGCERGQADAASDAQPMRRATRQQQRSALINPCTKSCSIPPYMWLSVSLHQLPHILATCHALRFSRMQHRSLEEHGSPYMRRASLEL
eukprot:1779098-Pleurochrysis_carterae.AAC.4